MEVAQPRGVVLPRARGVRACAGQGSMEWVGLLAVAGILVAAMTVAAPTWAKRHTDTVSRVICQIGNAATVATGGEGEEDCSADTDEAVDVDEVIEGATATATETATVPGKATVPPTPTVGEDGDVCDLAGAVETVISKISAANADSAQARPESSRPEPPCPTIAIDVDKTPTPTADLATQLPQCATSMSLGSKTYVATLGTAGLSNLTWQTEVLANGDVYLTIIDVGTSSGAAVGSVAATAAKLVGGLKAIPGSKQLSKLLAGGDAIRFDLSPQTATTGLRFSGKSPVLNLADAETYLAGLTEEMGGKVGEGAYRAGPTPAGALQLAGETQDALGNRLGDRLPPLPDKAMLPEGKKEFKPLDGTGDGFFIYGDGGTAGNGGLRAPGMGKVKGNVFTAEGWGDLLGLKTVTEDPDAAPLAQSDSEPTPLVRVNYEMRTRGSYAVRGGLAFGGRYQPMFQNRELVQLVYADMDKSGTPTAGDELISARGRREATKLDPARQTSFDGSGTVDGRGRRTPQSDKNGIDRSAGLGGSYESQSLRQTGDTTVDDWTVDLRKHPELGPALQSGADSAWAAPEVERSGAFAGVVDMIAGPNARHDRMKYRTARQLTVQEYRAMANLGPLAAAGRAAQEDWRLDHELTEGTSTLPTFGPDDRPTGATREVDLTSIGHDGKVPCRPTPPPVTTPDSDDHHVRIGLQAVTQPEIDRERRTRRNRLQRVIDKKKAQTKAKWDAAKAAGRREAARIARATIGADAAKGAAAMGATAGKMIGRAVARGIPVVGFLAEIGFALWSIFDAEPVNQCLGVPRGTTREEFDVRAKGRWANDRRIDAIFDEIYAEWSESWEARQAIDNNNNGGTAARMREAREHFEATRDGWLADAVDAGDAKRARAARLSMQRDRAAYAHAERSQTERLGGVRGVVQDRLERVRALKAEADRIAAGAATCTEAAGNVILAMDPLIKRTENDLEVLGQAIEETGRLRELDAEIARAGAQVARAVAAETVKAVEWLTDRGDELEGWMEDHRDRARDAAEANDGASARAEAAEVARLLRELEGRRREMTERRDDITSAIAILRTAPGLGAEDEGKAVEDLQKRLRYVDAVIAAMDSPRGSLARARAMAREAADLAAGRVATS